MLISTPIMTGGGLHVAKQRLYFHTPTVALAVESAFGLAASATAAATARQPDRNSFSKLCVKQIRDHSSSTSSSPRNENLRKPRISLIWPKTGSTIALRILYTTLPSGVRSLAFICSLTDRRSEEHTSELQSLR